MKSAGHLSVDQGDFCFLVYKHYLSAADQAFFWTQLRIFAGKAQWSLKEGYSLVFDTDTNPFQEYKALEAEAQDLVWYNT